MAERTYQDSNYRFTDPPRFFKANDPYYFEVDNIPLKQLQENCLWLRDQVRKDTNTLLGVKRSDLDELRPFASGGDRVLRVKPGRFTARINDAATKAPLAYLRKVMGEAVGDVDAWSTALPNPGNFEDGKNAILQAALDTFQTHAAESAMGMNGLAERAFTWPVLNSDTPINFTGVKLEEGVLSYAGNDLININYPGVGVPYSPMVISQALLWAKSQDSAVDSYILPSFETTNTNNGWAKFPRTENYFIKRWRGVSRLAIVDVDDEITIEVPQFDADDFAYTNSAGTTTPVTGVESRIDLVFIYSKPIDASATTILKPTGKEVITKPALGIVRGAGIKTNFQETSDFTKDYIKNLNDDHGIAAHPGDQMNTSMGFLSTSANDIAETVKGSFPAPDDILNLAPLISEKLEDDAYELVGQSILPVAYVWVQSGSQVVLSTDVIDIRPLFRTAELAYNERAGIGAAFPQLSLANPAVGKGQMDYEIKRAYDELAGRITVLDGVTSQDGINQLAMGYVFGGWNFGPEGAMYDFYQASFADDGSTDTNADAYIKQHIRAKYGIGSAGASINVPTYPDWDLAQWCVQQDIDSKGLYPNDYINTFISGGSRNMPATESDPSIVGGSYNQLVNTDGTTTGGGDPTRLKNFTNVNRDKYYENPLSFINFHYVSKKIKFDRSTHPNLADYKVDVNLVNCIGGTMAGSHGHHSELDTGTYAGHWVEKGFDEFTIYVSFVANDNNNVQGNAIPFPAPHSVTNVPGKVSTAANPLTISQRDGERFSGFVVPVGDILYSNTEPIAAGNGKGYVGNPRMAKCTYPTIMWSLTGIYLSDAPYLYGNLNGTNPTITLKN
tara:strand:+ start:853 stop:3378 length:2526 start_codon:yes stop_codon:yes gene_type:complete